ncbi:MAG TPA: hydrogenase maturation protease [Candidatus Deferrimicrobium sp.]|nr:hydrogenase maturation protease [Candidatus Deferrimicrobium sp.]
MNSVLVLCLGNDVLSDDAFGFRLSELLKTRADLSDRVEVIFAPLGGFQLLDLLKDRQRVLIVDTIITGNSPPGTLHYFPMGHLTPAHSLTGSHQINLPTALDLGRKLGVTMPNTIDVLAVEAQDVYTIGETLTPPVQAALEPAIVAVTDWISKQL